MPVRDKKAKEPNIIPSKIAAFDLDGTLLKKNSSFAFCQFLYQKNFFSRSELAYCALMYLRHQFFGLSLQELHRRVFERLFQGVSLVLLQAYLDPFLNEAISAFWYQPALSRLKSLHEQGFECIILSNSPFFLAKAIAKKLKINAVYATQYHCNCKGQLVGIELLMDGFQKAKILRNLDAKDIIAFSDSPLDLLFLEAAHTAVAVNPKRPLRRIAKTRGWEIL